MPKRKQGRPKGSTMDPAKAIKPCTFNISNDTKARIDKLRGNHARGKWLTIIINQFYP